MKVLYIFLLLFFPMFVKAEESNWVQSWQNGVSQISDKEYSEAISNITNCIIKFESEKEAVPYFLFIDRAEAFLGLNFFNECIADVNRVIDNSKAEKSDVVRALWIRTRANYLKGDVDACINDGDLVRSLDQNLPITTKIDNKLIIRNIQIANECQKKFLRQAMVSLSVCEKESDIHFSENMCVVKLKEQLKCSKSNCNSPVSKNLRMSEKALKSIEGCKRTCKFAFTGAQAFCSGFRGFCLGACLVIIAGLEDMCESCCATGKFYETCVKPFEDIISRMPAQCDPLREDG